MGDKGNSCRGYRPFLVTIISLVMCWNFLHSSASSSVTLSSLSVGSPFSRPACSSLSTALSSLDMQRSAEPGLHAVPPPPPPPRWWAAATAVPPPPARSTEDAEPDSTSSWKPSTFIWRHRHTWGQVSRLNWSDEDKLGPVHNIVQSVLSRTPQLFKCFNRNYSWSSVWQEVKNLRSNPQWGHDLSSESLRLPLWGLQSFKLQHRSFSLCFFLNCFYCKNKTRSDEILCQNISK